MGHLYKQLAGRNNSNPDPTGHLCWDLPPVPHQRRIPVDESIPIRASPTPLPLVDRGTGAADPKPPSPFGKSPCNEGWVQPKIQPVLWHLGSLSPALLFLLSFYFYFHVMPLSYYSLALFKTLILLLAGKREKNLL